MNLLGVDVSCIWPNISFIGPDILCFVSIFGYIYDQRVYCAVTPVCKNSPRRISVPMNRTNRFFYTDSRLILFWNGPDVSAFVVHLPWYRVQRDEP